MAKSKTKKHKRKRHRTLPGISAMQSAAPEDLQPGDYVALSEMMVQLLPSDAETLATGDTVTPLRVKVMPCDAGEPAKILAICLPFVTAVHAQGDVLTYDLRQERLVKLPPRYGKHVFKQHRIKS